MSGDIKVEFTIEPFVDGDLPAYVTAAIDALKSLGISPDVGPFGTAFTTSHDAVGRAVAAVLDAAYSHGATYVTVDTGPGS